MKFKFIHYDDFLLIESHGVSYDCALVVYLLLIVIIGLTWNIDDNILEDISDTLLLCYM